MAVYSTFFSSRKKTLLPLLFLLLAAGSLLARPAPPKPRLAPAPAPVAVDSAALFQIFVDSVNATFHYQTGHITLPGGIGELTVPRGFRYLDSTQSGYVLHKLWHNPPQTNLGMLFPADAAPLAKKS